jgi:hypothetical protein
MSAPIGSQMPEPPTDFGRLVGDLEREAKDEGLQAVNELEQLRHEFKLASARIASRRQPSQA